MTPARESSWPRALQHPALFALFDRVRDTIRNRAALHRFAARSVPTTAERVLIVRDRGIGDVLQISALFTPIRERYQARQVDLMTSASGAFLFQADERIDTVLLSSEPPADFSSNYDLVINLHLADHSPTATAAVRSVPAEKLLGRPFRDAREEAWYEYECGTDRLRKYCRIADVPYEPGMALGIRLQPDADRAREQEAFRTETLGDGPAPVAVCIGGADWRRNPPLDLLEALMDCLQERWPVMLLGMRRDRPEAEQAQLAAYLKDRPQMIDLLDCPFDELIYAIQSAAALVTPDTGPLHMALAVQTPVVALFGQMDWRRVLGPIRRSAHHVVLTPESGCQCCGYRLREDCRQSRHALCMDHFHPATIRAEVERILGR